MKFQLLIILMITLISQSFQLLKRTAKVETKSSTQTTKETNEVKASLADLNNNKINLNEGKSNDFTKEKVLN